MNKYPCLCGHQERHHLDECIVPGCVCNAFELDEEAIRDEEDQAKILRDDVRRGK
jgi:hypothetical protein